MVSPWVQFYKDLCPYYKSHKINLGGFPGLCFNFSNNNIFICKDIIWWISPRPPENRLRVSWNFWFVFICRCRRLAVFFYFFLFFYFFIFLFFYFFIVLFFFYFFFIFFLFFFIFFYFFLFFLTHKHVWICLKILFKKIKFFDPWGGVASKLASDRHTQTDRK